MQRRQLILSLSSLAAISAVKAKEARSAIKNPLPDFSAYCAVLIGHPIWWGKMPRS